MDEIFKNGLVGQTVIYKRYVDAGEFVDTVGLVVDKVIAESGNASATKYLILDSEFNITAIHFNKIKKIVVSTEFENAE
jgi:hypothetical protein